MNLIDLDQTCTTYGPWKLFLWPVTAFSIAIILQNLDLSYI